MTNIKFNLSTPAKKDLVELHELIHRAGDCLEDDQYQHAADVLQDAIKPLIFLIGKLRQEKIAGDNCFNRPSNRNIKEWIQQPDEEVYA